MFSSGKPNLKERVGAIAVSSLVAMIGGIAIFVETTFVIWFLYASLAKVPAGEAAAWGWAPGVAFGLITGGAAFIIVFRKMYRFLR